MNAIRDAAANMKLIQDVFIKAQSVYQEGAKRQHIFNFFESVPPEFISIAFEGMSMAKADVALKKEWVDFGEWNAFFEQNIRLHGTQIYIGLGWALAKHRSNPHQYAHVFNAGYFWRIFDGYGYYYGLFKKRNILNNQLPAYICPLSLGPFMQGVGRSLWYACQSDTSTLLKMLENFPEEYYTNLWRGIGLASAYVGGIKFNTMHDLSEQSGDYVAQLYAGAAMAYYSRFKAETLTESNFDWCKIWNNQTIHELIPLMRNIECKHSSNNILDYHAWILAMDNLSELIMN